MAKWVARDRRRRAASRNGEPAPSTAPSSGRPGPVVLALPEDMLTDRVDGRRRRPLHAGRSPSRRRPRCASCARCWPRRKRPLVILGGGGWNAQARAPTSAPSPKPTTLPVGCSFRRQDLFDNTHPELCRRRRHRHQPEAGRSASRTPTCCCVDRRAARRDDHRRLHADRHPGPDADAGPRPCRRRGTGPRLSGRPCRSTPACRPSPRPPRALRAGRRTPAWGDWTDGARTPTISTWSSRRHRPGRGADGRDHGLAARAPAGRRHHHQRRRQLRRPGCTASTATAASAPSSAPTSGSMGYGVPAARRRQARAPGPRRSSPSPATAAS